MSGFSTFPYSGKKKYFSCSPLSIALCNGASMRKYKIYWHMNFSLMGVAPAKITFVIIFSFEVALEIL